MENIRERINPAPRDLHYLPLSDLLSYLSKTSVSPGASILDYGAGNSPYRTMFPGSSYVTADYKDPLSSHCPEDVGIILPYDSTIAAEESSFDVVLSTQVMEHLPDPGNYLREAFRVLKPGGKLIVTTHGVWEDHGVPFDFQRWTAEGLTRDLNAAGFTDIVANKLTSGHRLHAFLILMWFGQLYSRTARLERRVVSKMVRELTRIARPSIHRIVDRLWPDCRVVANESIDQHKFYAGIAFSASKP